MADNSESLQETVFRLRQEAAEREQRDLQYQANALSSEIAELEAEAFQADANGEVDSVDYLMQEAREKSQQLNTVLTRLPQQPVLSETKQRWLARHMDLVNDPAYGLKHWAQNSKYGQKVNEHFLQTAHKVHDYAMRLGLQDDSPEYEKFMSDALEPSNYTPMTTPDEVIQEINKNSRIAQKYGGLSAKEYNRNVAPSQQRVMEQLTAQGKKP